MQRDPRGFPEWKAAGLPTEILPAAESHAALPSAGSGPLYGWSMVWTLIGVFAGGLALNLTPCVYPLIPITVSYFGSRAGQGRGRLAVHGLLYLGGLSVTNSALGVAAALTGSLMGAALQNPLVLVGVAAVLVFFATSLFGFWEMRLPHKLTTAASRPHAGYFGSLFMGLTLGVVAAPCLGPFVLGLLAWVAGLGSPWLGFMIFFTLSLGLGLPLFFLALFSGALEELPGSGEWMVWVRKAMGWTLVGMAAYFVRPMLPAAIGAWTMGLVAIAAGVHLAWIDDTQARSRSFGYLKQAAGAAGLAAGVFLIGSGLMAGPGIAWSPYSAELMEQARRAGRPVIVDFSATWCAPCRELEDITFHDRRVVVESQTHFVMIKVDLTLTSNPLQRGLVRKYLIKGVPTILFLDAQGQERSDLRLVNFVPPDGFLNRMNQVRDHGSSGS